jgi:hypothetical protein
LQEGGLAGHAQQGSAKELRLAKEQHEKQGSARDLMLAGGQLSTSHGMNRRAAAGSKA